MNRLLCATSLAMSALVGLSAQAQSVISAKSGLIHYTEGEVLLNDKPIAPKKSEFPRLEIGQILTTKAGRAELLLTPGVFLRLAENSEARMVSTALSDTRVELMSGSVLVEVGEMAKENSVMLTVGETKLDFRKHGLFRVDANPAEVRAFDGEAVVSREQQTLTVKEGRETLLSGVLSAEKFSKEDDADSFHRWASRRASYLSAANISAAKSVLDSGSVWNQGGWYFNSLFGLYTYLPGSGSYYSPFGYNYYSPGRVMAAYYRPVYAGNLGNFGGNSASSAGGMRSYNGSNGGFGRSAAYGGGGVSMGAPAAAAPATAVAAPRGGDSGAARGGGGGARGR